ncbi:MAG: serine--tRNA ligase, partial [Saprospiraceae bacterium]|nr:serine--tRNA ligase [Saprospiraceae bacterium]
MLSVNFIRQEKERVLRSLKIRNEANAEAKIENIFALDDERKRLQKALDDSRAELKKVSKTIGKLKREKKEEEAKKAQEATSNIKDKISELTESLSSTEDKLKEALLGMPNAAHADVPPGQSDEDNEVLQEWSADLPVLGDDAKPHWELMKEYRLVDQETGAKLSGAGFMLYEGKGARLQRALINFFLDEAEKAGYREHMPPLVVTEDTARATGQLPDKEGQMYYIANNTSSARLYLIPTAEVPLTNIYRDAILDEEDLPIRLAGHTPCFRREAGSYGADVKGLNRVHQFDKVEIVQIQHPERSYETLTEMCKHVEGLLQKLELPYRILRLCGGDLGFASALTYDFETYSAAQKRWLEVSSVSNFEEFQSNRLKLRFRPKGEKRKVLAHTLNGSALALPRILATLIENNQSPEGIRIPKALQPYTGFDLIKA